MPSAPGAAWQTGFPFPPRGRRPGRRIAFPAGAGFRAPLQGLGRGGARRVQVHPAGGKPGSGGEEGEVDGPERQDPAVQLGARSPPPQMDDAAPRRPGRMPGAEPSRWAVPGRRGARVARLRVWRGLGARATTLVPGAWSGPREGAGLRFRGVCPAAEVQRL